MLDMALTRASSRTETTSITACTVHADLSGTDLTATQRIEDAMLNDKLVTWALAPFTGADYITCVIYGLVTPQSLHIYQFLEIVLPAFS